MSKRNYSREKLSERFGVELTSEQYEDIIEIKKNSPAKTTYKNIVENYLSKDYYIERFSSQPVNSVYENLADYVNTNPDLKVFIKDVGQSDFMRVAAAVAVTAVGKINSEAWRRGLASAESEQKETGERGAYIPEIEVIELIESSTGEVSKIFLDFNTVDFAN